jgi:phosphoribosylamine--glycine ligase
LTVELSCFVLTDGKSYKILQQRKITNALAKATGLNTGGMGVSPVPYVDAVLMEK